MLYSLMCTLSVYHCWRGGGGGGAFAPEDSSCSVVFNCRFLINTYTCFIEKSIPNDIIAYDPHRSRLF